MGLSPEPTRWERFTDWWSDMDWLETANGLLLYGLLLPLAITYLVIQIVIGAALLVKLGVI
jgi:hypothetical protein